MPLQILVLRSRKRASEGSMQPRTALGAGRRRAAHRAARPGRVCELPETHGQRLKSALDPGHSKIRKMSGILPTQP